MTRAARPRPSVCTILRVAVLLGEADEADGHGPVGLDELIGPAVWFRPAERFPPGARALGLGGPGLCWLGEVSIVVGDGEVVVGPGLVDVGPGEVLVLVGTELSELPGDGLMVGDAELLTW